MRKLFFILLNLMFLMSFGFEDVQIIPQGANISLENTENENSLIDVNGLKRSDQVNDAKNSLKQRHKQKIKIDTNQIIQQSVLDYTTNQNNSMLLPRF